MKVTEAFLGEHGVFYAEFEHLEAILPTLERADIVCELAAVLSASLVSHAGLEDELVCAPLARHAGADMGPISTMQEEHVQIDGDLRRAIAASRLEDARSALLDAVGGARAHFAKEEQLLFPMAEEMLGDAELRALGRQWAERRGVTLRELEHRAP